MIVKARLISCFQLVLDCVSFRGQTVSENPILCLLLSMQTLWAAVMSCIAFAGCNVGHPNKTSTALSIGIHSSLQVPERGLRQAT